VLDSPTRLTAPFLSCVVPVRDEKHAATNLVSKLLELEPSRKLGIQVGEVIVVDDGSIEPFDGHDLSVHDDRVVIIRHPVARGYGAAIKSGIQRSQYGFIAWIDGDNTYAPEDLRSLIDALETNDQVIGMRLTDFGSSPRLRKAVKRLINKGVGHLWRTLIPDVNSGLRVFRRESLMTYTDEFPDGFSCSTTATLAALNRRHHIAFIPVHYRQRERNSGSKFRPVRDTWKLLGVIARQFSRAAHRS